MNPNKKTSPKTKPTFAGNLGTGTPAANDTAYNDLRRATLTALLWEDTAYKSGAQLFKEIDALITKVSTAQLSTLILELRKDSKLRHTPLYLIVKGMQTHKNLNVSELIPSVCTRVDMIADMVALYWMLNPKRANGKNASLPKQMRLGIAEVFAKVNEYSLAKYNNKDREVKLRDVLFLTHPKVSQTQQLLLDKLAKNTLATPDTWEVELSASKDKKLSWTRLLTEKKLGALAFLRNLRNMVNAGVEKQLVSNYFTVIDNQMLMPQNYLTAIKSAPEFKSSIESLMLRNFANVPKLAGHTVLLVDVSGSMGSLSSEYNSTNRLDLAVMSALLAVNLCENITVIATAGSDRERKGAHKIISNPSKSFDLFNQIEKTRMEIGQGGIFTRQAIDFVKENVKGVDRIMVFSDSEDCDRENTVPTLFAKNNYIINVAPSSKGINYNNKWTAEINGMSDKFIQYVMALEGVKVFVGED